MLPLIPVLLMLLLQGPSSLERLAAEGKLPAALETLHRQMRLAETQPLTETEEVRAPDTVIASLMAIRSDAEFSRSLFRVFGLEAPRPTVEIDQVGTEVDEAGGFRRGIARFGPPCASRFKEIQLCNSYVNFSIPARKTSTR